jgi:hypothetical protein
MPTVESTAALRRMLGRFDPAVQELAWTARELIIEALPEVVEVVWERQGTAGYGTGPRKNSEHFCWIAPQRAHVNLGFNYGSELPDPDGLLEGTGTLFRHVKLRSAADVGRLGLRTLVVTASGHRVPPLTPP